MRWGLIARAIEDHGAGDLVAQVISAKVLAVCFELPPFVDATALLQSIATVADVSAARANGSLN